MLYGNAMKNNEEVVISVDEMTGIQALERIAPDLPMLPGKPQSIEFEYTRHGTQTLLGGFNVATGIIQGICLGCPNRQKSHSRKMNQIKR